MKKTQVMSRDCGNVGRIQGVGAEENMRNP